MDGSFFHTFHTWHYHSITIIETKRIGHLLVWIVVNVIKMIHTLIQTFTENTQTLRIYIYTLYTSIYIKTLYIYTYIYTLYTSIYIKTLYIYIILTNRRLVSIQYEHKIYSGPFCVRYVCWFYRHSDVALPPRVFHNFLIYFKTFDEAIVGTFSKPLNKYFLFPFAVCSVLTNSVFSVYPTVKD